MEYRYFRLRGKRRPLRVVSAWKEEVEAAGFDVAGKGPMPSRSNFPRRDHVLLTFRRESVVLVRRWKCCG